MNEYVLILSVGPVQSMISAARRSRDLWSGSGLLSELAKACAKSVKEQGGDLIFPAVDDAPQRLLANSDFSVGNKIQAIVKAASQARVREIVEQAKQATQARLEDEATLVLQEIKMLGDLRQELWDLQIQDYLEIQAAWAVINEQQPYTQAVEQAARALAARKATRDFKAAAFEPYDPNRMLPKSSLDGAFETVLQETKVLKNQTRRKLGLSDSEQLDALGVIKRLGLKKQAEQFTPFSRIASDAWIEKVSSNDEGKALLEEVKTAYQALVQADMATGVRGNDGIYASLPFDGQFLYRYRLDNEKAKCNDAKEAELIQQFDKSMRPVWKKFGQPCSYGVMLLADGDRMGELLDKATTLEQHKVVTEALSGFAGQVSEIMRDYRGHCIYAGGDDVLGFVPLTQAYDCAKALSQSFEKALEPIAKKLGSAASPTLSVGLAIAHHLTPLSMVRRLAAQAEQQAKGDHVPVNERRNALGVALDVRSGNITQLRLRWNDAEAQANFRQWIDYYKHKSVPSRVAYGTRNVELQTCHITTDKILLGKIQAAEIKRMLEKARIESGHQLKKEVVATLTQCAQSYGLRRLSEELIVARWLAAKTQLDLGKDE